MIVTISWLDKSSTEHRKMIELAKDDKKRLEEDLSELRKVQILFPRLNDRISMIQNEH